MPFIFVTHITKAEIKRDKLFCETDRQKVFKLKFAEKII
jgi:hypothetical protein